MIEVSFKEINDTAFHTGVQKLIAYPGFTPKQAYRIGRLADKIGSVTNEARATYKKFIDKYAEKTDKGEIVKADAPPFFKLKEGADTAAFDKEYLEFLDIKVSLDRCTKLALSELPEGLGLTARDIRAIECLIDFEEEQDNVVPLKKN